MIVTQKALIERVSKITGETIETVTVIDRLLAEAGLRTKAKRGRGITPMTTQDAANLLFATVASRNPAAAATTVRRGKIATTQLNAALQVANKNRASAEPSAVDAFIWSHARGEARVTYTVSGPSMDALAESLFNAD